MKIASIRIQNLRSFADETIPLNDYTCLVGPNGSGKSTVFCALNIFFRETDNVSTDLIQLDREDFHYQNTNEPIRITVTFTDLNEEAQKKDFADRPCPTRGRSIAVGMGGRDHTLWRCGGAKADAKDVKLQRSAVFDQTALWYQS